jgi:tetratricopeptide (TPR) repeat protein
MRKLWLIVLIIAIVGVFVILKSRRGTTGPDVTPEILNITSSQATVAWLSEKEYKGRVFYRPAGSQTAPLSAIEAFGASKLHEVVLTGLHPASRYSYWLENSESRFQFQTQPAANDPFSFLIVWGNVSERIISLMRSESAEFIISLTGQSRQNFDQFSNVRAYVPVYNFDGADSPFLKATAGKAQNNSDDLWKLDWGGLRLIFINGSADAAKITDMLDTPAAHTIGLIINSSDIIGELEPEKISETALHSILLAHNKRHPTKPAAFAAVNGKEAKDAEVNGIRYFGIDTANKSGAVRIDTDVESARAVFIDEGKEVALKQPPLKQKRTCEECRRLADKGAYEQSIKAYLEFIETHKDSFQIDDAYFAIADIYDGKLFDFEKALLWYNRLAKEYPDSTFVPLANQRIKYIAAYRDYEYKPLAGFERIKVIEYARKKELPEEENRIFGQVESLINEYPDSNIAPVMQHWLANQYRLREPDKAVEAYMRLRKNYGGHSEAQEAMLEIGETYYDAARYKEAIVAFNEAMSQLPALADTIKAQIARAERNLRRDKIAYVCWAVLAVICGISFAKKPRIIDADRISWCAAAFVIIAVLLAFGAWLVHEQFNSTGEMVRLVIFFSLTASLSMLISMNLANKLLAKRKTALKRFHYILSTAIGSLAGIIFFLAGMYLTIYYVYVHYLIVVKL